MKDNYTECIISTIFQHWYILKPSIIKIIQCAKSIVNKHHQINTIQQNNSYHYQLHSKFQFHSIINNIQSNAYYQQFNNNIQQYIILLYLQNLNPSEIYLNLLKIYPIQNKLNPKIIKLILNRKLRSFIYQLIKNIKQWNYILQQPPLLNINDQRIKAIISNSSAKQARKYIFAFGLENYHTPKTILATTKQINLFLLQKGFNLNDNKTISKRIRPTKRKYITKDDKYPYNSDKLGWNQMIDENDNKDELRYYYSELDACYLNNLPKVQTLNMILDKFQ